MARTFYSVVLCLTLGLLATMWLRPGVAQDLIDFAHSVVRAQSPDPQSIPQAAPFGNQPYDNAAGPPKQPMAVTRPVTWPGTPVDSYNAAVNGGAGNNAGVASSYGTSPATPRPGVTVWDPRSQTMVPAPTAGGYAVPPPSNASASYNNQPPLQVVQAPAPSGVMPTMSPQQSPYGQAPQVNPMRPNPTATNSIPAGYDGQPYPMTATPTEQSIPARGNPQPSQPPPAAGQPMQPNLGAPNVQVLPGEPKDVPDSQIVAKIGTEAVLRSDIKAMTYAVLQQKKLDVPADQMEQFFDMAERPLLKQLVEMKLVYNDAIHNIPAEGMKKIQAGINDSFDKEQLPQLLTTYGVSTRQELEAKLRERGSSIETERRSFFEKNLYSGWMHEKIKRDQEISAAEILGYYTQHTADYEFPAQARWEELMVSFSHVPDKQAAFDAIATMGNDVMRGAALAEVAKAKSDGLTASSGGVFDWTTQGSLAAKQVDAAVFQLPVGKLSQIIETDRGYHIIRVVERKDAGRKSFEDTQSEIRKKLKEQALDRQVKTYFDELRKKTPIWTIFDNQPGGLDGPPKEVSRIPADE